MIKKFGNYILRTKWLTVVFVCIILIIFGRTVNTPTLTKTAIVIGAGIDMTQNGEFEVTTQTVFVGSSVGNTQSATSYATYSHKASTVSSALDAISQKMGLSVSLAHCNVLVLSKSAMKCDPVQLLTPLTKSFALPMQAVIVTGQQSPKDLLSKRIGVTISSPFFLQSTLLNQDGSDGIIRITTKDYLAHALSKSGSVAMPYLIAKQVEQPPMSEQSQGEDSTFEFDMDSVFAFSKNGSVVIPPSLAEVLTIYLANEPSGTLNYSNESGNFDFKILDKSVSAKASGFDVQIEMELSVDLIGVQFAHEQLPSAASELVRAAAQDLAKDIGARIERLQDIALQNGVDFLNLQTKVYQSLGRDMPNDCLDKIEVKPKVSITVQEAA